MTLITDLPAGTVDGAEEYVIQRGATEYNVTGTQILASVVATHSAYVTSNDAAVSANTTGKLNLSGGIMTGKITLDGDPTANLHAATKQYVDAGLATKANSTGASLDATATGVTATDTTESTVLATTGYVASKVEYEVLKKTSISSTPVTLTYADRGTIAVDHTATAPVVLNLPQISALTSAERTEYYIVDTGLNAETNSITINAFAGDTINGATSVTLNSDGESIILATKGTTKWFIKDKVTSASTTVAGLLELATTAEAKALSSATLAVSPSTLGDVVDDRLYKFENIGAATEVVVEADAGTIYHVSYTSTGTVAVTLPDPTSLASSGRFVIEVWDTGTASTNNITITPASGNIDGAANFKISKDKAGCKIFTDGTNYFTLANTARAATATASTLANILANGNTSGAKNLIMDTGQSIKFSNSGFKATVAESTLTGDITITLPAATGTLALAANVFPLTGGTITGSIILDNSTGGKLQISDGTYTGTFTPPTFTASRGWTFPDTTGTVALTNTVTLQNVMDNGDNTATGLTDNISWDTTGTITLTSTAGSNAFRFDGRTGANTGAWMTLTDSSFKVRRYTTGTIDQEITLESSGMIVLDDANSKGLEYDADYSGNYTARSLVDKAYVDTLKSAAAYTPTSVVTDRAYDANSTTVEELADVLGTLIADLQATGIIS
jgi:hypothetical protein